MVESKSPPGPHFSSSTSIMLIFGWFFLSEMFQQLLDGCTLRKVGDPLTFSGTTIMSKRLQNFRV